MNHPETDSDDEDEGREECPVCEHPYNHKTDHGERLEWPSEVDYQICTPPNSDEVYVHTRGDPDDDYWDESVEEFLERWDAEQGESADA